MFFFSWSHHLLGTNEMPDMISKLAKMSRIMLLLSTIIVYLSHLIILPPESIFFKTCVWCKDLKLLQ